MGIRVRSKSHADSLVYWSGDIITRYTTIHSNETETAKDGVESRTQSVNVGRSHAVALSYLFSIMADHGGPVSIKAI